VITDKLTSAIFAKMVLFFCTIFCHFSLSLHFGNQGNGRVIFICIYKITLFPLIVNVLKQHTFYITTNALKVWHCIWRRGGAQIDCDNANWRAKVIARYYFPDYDADELYKQFLFENIINNFSICIVNNVDF